MTKILVLAKRPEIKATPKNEVEATRLRFVKAVLDYTWRYSQKAFKIKLPVFDIFITRRKDG